MQQDPSHAKTIVRAVRSSNPLEAPVLDDSAHGSQLARADIEALKDSPLPLGAEAHTAPREYHYKCAAAPSWGPSPAPRGPAG